MSANFRECYFDLPATDEPGEDVAGTSVEVGGEEGLRFELAFGIATRSQRIGTGGTPLRYHNAVPLAMSTRWLVRPYQRLTR